MLPSLYARTARENDHEIYEAGSFLNPPTFRQFMIRFRLILRTTRQEEQLMKTLGISWRIEDNWLVCRWRKAGDSTREIAIPIDVASARKPEYWNSDVVFELGDAA